MPTKAEVKQARIDAGLTQGQAAELIGVSLRTWQFWEAGKYNMRDQSWRLFNILLARK